MGYVLKLFDEQLLKFEMIDHSLTFTTRILNLEILNTDIRKLPIGMTASEESLLSWLKRRIIPKNRKFVNEILENAGIKDPSIKNIIDVSLGLSLNDCYWVVPDTFSGKYSDYNLYENNFDTTLAIVAYTGYGSKNKAISTSPELTTDGMLRKAWRHLHGKPILYKGGTEGAANAGNEPYSEYLASQIADCMQINHVRYDLEKWKGIICSTCECFCNLNTSYVQMHRLVDNYELYDVVKRLSISEKMLDDLATIFIFDALIINGDRHLSNFGVLQDTRTQKIIGLAPIFDNGAGMLSYFLDTELKDGMDFGYYRYSALGPRHDDMAALFMGPTQKSALRRLIGFKLHQHPIYKIDQERFNFLNKLITHRVNYLLRIPNTDRGSLIHRLEEPNATESTNLFK